MKRDNAIWGVFRKDAALLALIITLGCGQVFTQIKSDREKEGLIGLVAKIKIESTFFKLESGKWVESARKLWGESEYDKSGKLMKTKKNTVLGDPILCEEKFKYDNKGRESEKLCVSKSSEKVIEKYSYEEDTKGNWTKRVASIPDGNSFRPQSTLYREITYFP